LNNIENYRVIGEAANGKQFLELLEKEVPDLVLLDINMPVMDGLEAVKQIMDMDSQAKIIMLSAIGDDEVVKRAESMGVYIFLKKPFDDYKIISAISKIE